ncbi:unnamed protein product, partial [Ectocarpus sp. 12 AP-2014]
SRLVIVVNAILSLSVFSSLSCVENVEEARQVEHCVRCRRMTVTDNIQPQDSPVDEHRYTKIFEKLDTEDGYLSGKRAVVLLRKSGVPEET